MEMLPGARDSIVDRAKIGGIRVGIGEAAAGFKIDDKFE